MLSLRAPRSRPSEIRSKRSPRENNWQVPRGHLARFCTLFQSTASSAVTRLRAVSELGSKYKHFQRPIHLDPWSVSFLLRSFLREAHPPSTVNISPET
jgi:hypothetical protein